MACASLVALPRACGTQGIIAGVEKLYMLSAADLAPASGVAGSPIYTATTAGVISDIGLVASKFFVPVGILKSTVGLNEDGQFNEQNGSAFFKQEFTLTLSDLTTENRQFVESVLTQPVAVLIKTRTEKYFVAGLNSQLQLSAVKGGTGTAEADLIGYTLTFSGLDTKLIPMVDSALVPSLLA